MKPSQPKFVDFFDRIAVYETSGTRTDTGGFSEQTTLLRTIWASAKVSTKSELIRENERVFRKGIKIKCRKNLIAETNFIIFNGATYYIENVNTDNPAMDIAQGNHMG